MSSKPHRVSVSDRVSVIDSKLRWWYLPLREVFRYQDLLWLFVRRDFVAFYKQTVLGPLWFFIQPIIQAFIYAMVFGRVANIPTDGTPPMLFYVTNIVIWTYFADCLRKTSGTFTNNAAMFSKVYFPRIIVPLSITLSSLIKLGIQLVVLALMIMIFALNGQVAQPGILLIALPLLLVITAGLGLAVGIIISSLTTKYRDFQYLVEFGVQLAMFATPVIYPLSVTSGRLRQVLELKPMSSIVEAFRKAVLGQGTVDFGQLAYSFCFMLVLLTIGLTMFHRVEKNFVDTV